jgi:multidrug resistance efflux pump
MSNRQFDEKIAEAQLASVQAKLAKAEAAQKRDELLLERLTVRAPRKGTILQVNVRAGEYASVQGNQALILMGDLSAYQIRADVDEQNAGRVVSGKPAKAYLKGDTKTALPLSFVRVEPYVIPKQSLTGASTERVDTRVLQVIYRLDASPTLRAYVGQQVDVFIEAE